MTGFSFLAVLAIKSSLIWGIAWLAAGLLRRRSAAARHLVWTCAAAAIVALPLFTALLPALEVAPAVADPGLWFQAEATAGGGPGAASTALQAAPERAGRSPRRVEWETVLMLIWAAGVGGGSIRILLAWAAVRRLRRDAKPFATAGWIPVLETRAGSMPCRPRQQGGARSGCAACCSMSWLTCGAAMRRRTWWRGRR